MSFGMKEGGMRQQYHFRTVGRDTLIWDVVKLVRMTAGFPVVQHPLAEIAELDEDWWYAEPQAVPTPRSLAAHMALVQAADLDYPVILCAEGRLMDGMHRAVKAVMEGRDTVPVVRFEVTPAPDFRNVPAHELPY
jgi:hypothetical protein